MDSNPKSSNGLIDNSEMGAQERRRIRNLQRIKRLKEPNSSDSSSGDEDLKGYAKVSYPSLSSEFHRERVSSPQSCTKKKLEDQNDYQFEDEIDSHGKAGEKQKEDGKMGIEDKYEACSSEDDEEVKSQTLNYEKQQEDGKYCSRIEKRLDSKEKDEDYNSNEEIDSQTSTDEEQEEQDVIIEKKVSIENVEKVAKSNEIHLIWKEISNIWKEVKDLRTEFDALRDEQSRVCKDAAQAVEAIGPKISHEVEKQIKRIDWDECIKQRGSRDVEGNPCRARNITLMEMMNEMEIDEKNSESLNEKEDLNNNEHDSKNKDCSELIKELMESSPIKIDLIQNVVKDASSNLSRVRKISFTLQNLYFM